MKYLFYILLSFLPSLIWLSFYLKKDKHPEPRRMVVKIFIWGMLLAPLAVILELLLIWLLEPNINPLILLSENPTDGLIKIILANTLVPALVEEYLKYSVVKVKVVKNPAFDEPVDAMLYCVIVGLGFAAVENLLILSKMPLVSLQEAILTMGFRFLGATFIHALASAIVGYWLAKGLLHIQKRKKFIVIGLTIAIIFHSCYNYFIISIFNQTTEAPKLFYLLITTLLIVSTALLVSFYFNRLKKEQSICLES